LAYAAYFVHAADLMFLSNVKMFLRKCSAIEQIKHKIILFIFADNTQSQLRDIFPVI
jgi:hypothetical protein